MNKVYRLVWSERSKSYVAVPELARSRGKGGDLVLATALTLVSLFMPTASAQVSVASGNTTVNNAANGVPVVGIATTNAAGLSHNKYNNFNVEAKGLVLNNNATASAVQSQLAGAVAKNANLSNAANVILNEVVTQNRSALKGYMEVAGTRADVIVANPWGITCNGCGFINTDRATLGTGVPALAGDGSLSKLSVSQGDILVNGAGLNGASQNILDIVARSVVLDGQIKANDVKLVAGPNDYSYAQRSATVLAATGTAPSYAIDSTLLGGMYAQKISLIGTEQGVGVRLLGDVAARGSDFTLTTAGAIELRSKSISAERDIAATSSAGKLALGGTALFAKGALDLNASAGEISLDATSTAEALGNIKIGAGSAIRNQGKLKGAGQVTVQASNGAVQLENSGLIQATAKLILGTSGHLVNLNNSAKLLAGDTLTIEGGSLVNSDTVQATKGSVIQAATLSNVGSGAKWLLSTEAGTAASINLTASLDNQGLLQSAGSLSATASGALRNSGSISVPAAIGVTSTLRLAADTLTNSGSIVGSGPTTLSGTKSSGTSISNNGQINSAGVLLTLSTGGGAIDNAAAGEIISNYDLAITTSAGNASLSNAGRIQSVFEMTLGGKDHSFNINNSAPDSVILSEDILKLSAGSLVNLGTIQAQNGATVSGTSLINGSAGNSTASMILAFAEGADSALQLSALENYGKLAASGTMTVNADKITNRAGALIFATDSTLLKGALNLTASSTISNWGVISGSANTKIQTTTSTEVALINYSGATLRSNGDMSIGIQGKASNAGSIEVGGTLGITARDSLSNSATITSLGSMTVSSDGNFVLDNSAAASVIEAGGKFNYRRGERMNGSTPTAQLINQGTITGTQGFQLDVSNLTNGSASNSGAKILATQASENEADSARISAQSGFSNFGAIYSANNLWINADNIQNQNTGGILSSKGLALTGTRAINNWGALYSGNQGLNLSSSQDINNYTGGSIQALTVFSASSNKFNNYGAIRAGSVAITTATKFFNGLETPVTAVLDLSGTVGSSADEPVSVVGVPWKSPWWWSQGNLRSVYQDAVTYREKYSSPLPEIKPQILASDLLTLDYGNGEATNFAGILSGNTINIRGSGVFTNKDLSLDEITYYRRAMYELYPTAGYYPATGGNWSSYSNVNEKTAGSGSIYNALDSALANSYRVEKSRVTYSSAGAGVYANKLLNVSAGQLQNLGSPYTFTDNRLAQGGFSIILPGNPNGYFVQSLDSKSRYLVITNPLLFDEVANMETMRIEELLGYSMDEAWMRLGDANYEDFLISQQLIFENASSSFAGDGAALISSLRNQSVAEAGSQKLKFGEELTPEQIKRLSNDIVWMVKTKVGNKTVLVPRVYLSEATRTMIKGGAVMSAKNTHINADSVSNSGGTIAGTEKLAIKTTGSIRNESGKLTGGSVSLIAKGSIINKTLTQGKGDASSFRTTIGKTGQIEATTATLTMSSGQNIVVQGAQIKAAKSASLAAVGAVSFETIVDKTTTSSGALDKNGNTIKTTTTEKNIGSSLTAEKIDISSSAAITIRGSQVKSSGDLSLHGKEGVNIVADQDKTTTHTVSKASGFGVGGGVYGTETKTTDEFKGTNVGSTVSVAGDAKITSDAALTVQGSQLDIAGNAKLNAKQGINVLDGKDVATRTTKTETTAFLKIVEGKGTTTSAKDAADAKAGAGKADAKSDAGVEAASRHDLKLFEKTTTTKKEKDETRSVESTLKVGKDLAVSTDGTLRVQGSRIETGGSMSLNADRVEVVAGINTKEAGSETVRISVGLIEESNAKANAKSNAQARGAAIPNVGGSGAASVNVSAKAGADSTVTIGVKIEKEDESKSNTTHSVSSLTSKGDMKIVAKNDALFAGVNVVSGGKIAIIADNILNIAVKDVKKKNSSKDSHTAGVYVSGEASAGASANAAVQAGLGFSAEAAGKIAIKAEGTQGLRYKKEDEADNKDTVTHVTNSFVAANDITRTAFNVLKDQATQMNSGGSIKSTAKVTIDEAVHNSTAAREGKKTHDARVGAYAGASAEANASGYIGTGVPDAIAKIDVKAGVGAKAGYVGAIADSGATDTTAVTSKYIAAKGITSTSSEKTTLEGTQYVSGGDVAINAHTLEYKDVKDTDKSSTRNKDIDAHLTVTTVGTPGVDVGGGYTGKNTDAASSSARVGSINAGGKVTINTDGDANFTGTQIKSVGKTTINAQGDVNLKAAQSTSKSSAQDINGKVGINVGNTLSAVDINGAYGKGDKSLTTGQGVTIESTGGIDVNSGKSITMEGAKLATKGDVSLLARDKVKLLETTKHETETNYDIAVGIKAKHQTAKQKEAKQKETEQKAAEQKVAQQKAVDKTAAVQKAAVQKAAVHKEAAQKAVDKTAAVQKEAVQKEAIQKEAAQKAAEATQKAAVKQAAAQKETEATQKEAAQKEAAAAQKEAAAAQKEAAAAQKDATAAQKEATAAQKEATAAQKDATAAQKEAAAAQMAATAAQKAAETKVDAPKVDAKAPPKGINGHFFKYDEVTSTATSIEAAGKINIKANTVVDQNAKVVSEQGKPNIEGVVEKMKQTETKTVINLELPIGSPIKKKD